LTRDKARWLDQIMSEMGQNPQQIAALAEDYNFKRQVLDLTPFKALRTYPIDVRLDELVNRVVADNGFLVGVESRLQWLIGEIVAAHNPSYVNDAGPDLELARRSGSGVRSIGASRRFGISWWVWDSLDGLLVSSAHGSSRTGPVTGRTRRRFLLSGSVIRIINATLKFVIILWRMTGSVIWSGSSWNGITSRCCRPVLIGVTLRPSRNLNPSRYRLLSQLLHLLLSLFL
jgi:hypothetical protein